MTAPACKVDGGHSRINYGLAVTPCGCSNGVGGDTPAPFLFWLYYMTVMRECKHFNQKCPQTVFCGSWAYFRFEFGAGLGCLAEFWE